MASSSLSSPFFVSVAVISALALVTACTSSADGEVGDESDLTGAKTCSAQLGQGEASKLADQCRQVSPATHPPCHPSNSCALIRDEIKRGCGLLKKNAPAYCSAELTCAQELGAADAKKLTDQCIMVSPATHPPCNAANSCDLVRDEIKRSCKLLGSGAPSYCKTTK